MRVHGAPGPIRLFAIHHLLIAILVHRIAAIEGFKDFATAVVGDHIDRQQGARIKPHALLRNWRARVTGRFGFDHDGLWDQFNFGIPKRVPFRPTMRLRFPVIVIAMPVFGQAGEERAATDNLIVAPSQIRITRSPCVRQIQRRAWDQRFEPLARREITHPLKLRQEAHQFRELGLVVFPNVEK